MTQVARVTEITARSEHSFEDAVRTGIERATQTLRNVSGAWVKEQKLAIEDGQIKGYQVDMLVTFVLDEGASDGAAGGADGQGYAARQAGAPNQAPAEGVPHERSAV